jgi:two-component system response regulator AtoC
MRRSIVLIVEDAPTVRKALELMLAKDYETLSADDGKKAVDIIKELRVDLVLLDITLPVMDGFEVLQVIKDVSPETGVIMLTGSDSAEKAVRALKMGAYDYITKPFDPEDLLSTIKRYTEKSILGREVAFLKEELYSGFSIDNIVHKSKGMQEVLESVKKIAASTSSVLITGESGTGKELIARAIHFLSDRRDRPFVTVNCGAIPNELIESELFGHVKGAFTGAVSSKVGKFEYADGGTLFLDEVATLSMPLQVSLLRVLQEKSFEKVGSNKLINVDIRVLAATNIELKKAVEDGRFREDLYYRLRVIPIDLPPLRYRKEDIPSLVRHFLELHSKVSCKEVTRFSPEVLDKFCKYDWPGNVRELENMVERLVVLATEDGGVVTINDLPQEIITSKTECPLHALDVKDFKEACTSFERQYITKVLCEFDWNKTKAADSLKLHRNTLQKKINILGINQMSVLKIQKDI